MPSTSKAQEKFFNIAAHDEEFAKDHGIDPEVAMEAIAVTRHYDGDLNKYFLDIALTSMVFKASASFAMPKHFSETVTIFELNGFIYSPIDPAAVVE